MILNKQIFPLSYLKKPTAPMSCMLSPFGKHTSQDACLAVEPCGLSWRCAKANTTQNGVSGEVDESGTFIPQGQPIEVRDGTYATADECKCYNCTQIGTSTMCTATPTNGVQGNVKYKTQCGVCKFVCGSNGSAVMSDAPDAVLGEDLKCWGCDGGQCVVNTTGGTHATQWACQTDTKVKCGWLYEYNSVTGTCDQALYGKDTLESCEFKNKVGWKWGCFDEYACRDGMCMGIPATGWNSKRVGETTYTSLAACEAASCTSTNCPPLLTGSWEAVRVLSPNRSLTRTANALLTFTAPPVARVLTVPSVLSTHMKNDYKYTDAFFNASRTWYDSNQTFDNQPVASLGTRIISPSVVEFVFFMIAFEDANHPYVYKDTTFNGGGERYAMYVTYVDITPGTCVVMPTAMTFNAMCISKAGTQLTTNTDGNFSYKVGLRQQPNSAMLWDTTTTAFPNFASPPLTPVSGAVRITLDPNGTPLIDDGWENTTCSLSPYGTHDTKEACAATSGCGAKWRCAKNLTTVNGVQGEYGLFQQGFVPLGSPIQAWDGTFNTPEECKCYICDFDRNTGVCFGVPTNGTQGKQSDPNACASAANCRFGCDTQGNRVLSTSNLAAAWTTAKCWNCEGTTCEISNPFKPGKTQWGNYFTKTACENSGCSWKYGCDGVGGCKKMANGTWDAAVECKCYSCTGNPGPDSSCSPVGSGAVGTFATKAACENDASVACGWKYGCQDGTCLLKQSGTFQTAEECKYDPTEQCGWMYGCFTKFACIDGTCIGVDEDFSDANSPTFNSMDDCTTACGGGVSGAVRFQTGLKECNIMSGVWSVSGAGPDLPQLNFRQTQSGQVTTYTSDAVVRDPVDGKSIPVATLEFVHDPMTRTLYVDAWGMRVDGTPWFSSPTPTRPDSFQVFMTNVDDVCVSVDTLMLANGVTLHRVLKQ